MIRTLLAGALALVLLSGCSLTGGDAPASGAMPKKIDASELLADARTGLAIAKLGASLYSALPTCDDVHKPPLCWSPAGQAQVDKAMATASGGLDLAEKVVATVGSDAAARDKAIQIAADAIAEAIKILGRYQLGGM